MINEIISTIGFLIGTTLMYSTPLIYSSLGGTISENSGVVNIGLEGIMTIGAFVGAAVGFFVKSAWIGFFAAGMAGGLLALIHAIVSITFCADQIISGIAINFIGPGLALFISRLLFNGATNTESIPLENKIPRPFKNIFPENSFFDLVFDQYATVYIAIFLVILLWLFLYKTKYGFRIRAVGEYPEACDTVGINVYKIRYFSVILSGVLAGMGGASITVAIVSNFSPTRISGQGFIALAAMIFGRWKPQGAFFACLLFAFSQAIAIILPGLGINISSSLLNMLPYIITLFSLIIIGIVFGNTKAPAADGKIFSKILN